MTNLHGSVNTGDSLPAKKPKKSHFVFEVYSSCTPVQWRWRLITRRGGKIVADSGEGYSSKSACLRTIRKIQAFVGDAAVEFAP